MVTVMGESIIIASSATTSEPDLQAVVGASPIGRTVEDTGLEAELTLVLGVFDNGSDVSRRNELFSTLVQSSFRCQERELRDHANSVQDGGGFYELLLYFVLACYCVKVLMIQERGSNRKT